MINNLDDVAEAHARELNKSIEKIALNILIGLSIIAVAVYTKK